MRLGLDDGANVEVLEGLRGGEVVALNLGAEVADGAAVRTTALSPGHLAMVNADPIM